MRALGRLPESTEVVRGYDGLKAFFTGLLGMLDMRLEADELIDAGDSVVVVLRMIARGRGSGAELTNHMVFVYGFREERICRVDAYGTKAEALEAVGPRE